MNSLDDRKSIVLKAADRMPFLPHAFQQAISLLATEGDDVSVAKLASVIEQDVVMTG